MTAIKINRNNVGRIAERIVSNELEARGFRVSGLNSDGTAANADLLAVGHGRTLQVQVKGAVNGLRDRWWIQYGYCTEAIIGGPKERMFNRHESFYKADFVILAASRSPNKYQCIILPVEEAERAAQLALERDYRRSKADGEAKKPNKVWLTLDSSSREKANALRDQEREILAPYRNSWGILTGNVEPMPIPERC